MRIALTLARFQWHDAIRNRWVLSYTGFFLLCTEGLLRVDGGEARAVVSIGSVMLLVVPLVGLVFGTVFLYNSREYTELLLAQPVPRAQLYGGLLAGLSSALAAGFLAGVGLPFVWRGGVDPSLYAMLATLLAAGALLSLLFVAIAFAIATAIDDRLRGLGMAIGAWLLLALLYDGLVMLLVATFPGMPLEKPLLVLVLANPLDLVRIALLIQSDTAALMGYTGAVFTQFFGSASGLGVAILALAAWVAAPVVLGLRVFARKDF